MTRYLLTAFSLIAMLSATAQTEGVVTYEETIKLTFQVPREYADMIPKEQKRKTSLVFNENESLYKYIPEETNVATEIETQNSMAGMIMRFQAMRNNNEVYKNLQTDKVIEKQQFFGRDFLITGEEKINWKMTGEQKRIGNYMCMKATYMRDTVPVIAWFTPQIPVSFGPNNVGQLPGMILETDMNNGMYVITAIDVALRPLKAEEAIVMPDKGKEVTREEFNKIRDEKMKEMREMGGGSGGGRMIMRGN